MLYIWHYTWKAYVAKLICVGLGHESKMLVMSEHSIALMFLLFFFFRVGVLTLNLW